MRSQAVLMAVAMLSFAGLASAAIARSDAPEDHIVVAVDDNTNRLAPSPMQTDGMKPDSEAQPDDQSGAPGSAKMGTDEGTHTGDGQGAKPESDTSKVEQPERRNVPSNDQGAGQK